MTEEEFRRQDHTKPEIVFTAVDFDYVAEATQTLSNQFHGELVSKPAFANALNSSIDALRKLDKVKKSLFYGKENGLSLNGLPDTSNLPELIGGDATEAINFIHGVIGLATEAGELLELLRDTLNGEPLDKTNLKEEIGDGKWYMAILSTVGKFTWGADERANIAKLRARFPDKFTEYDANNRNLASERKILES
jgi:NTP pyrophosphatase (non-canonical NTP hydrolase)